MFSYFSHAFGIIGNSLFSKTDNESKLTTAFDAFEFALSNISHTFAHYEVALVSLGFNCKNVLEWWELTLHVLLENNIVKPMSWQYQSDMLPQSNKINRLSPKYTSWSYERIYNFALFNSRCAFDVTDGSFLGLVARNNTYMKLKTRITFSKRLLYFKACRIFKVENADFLLDKDASIGTMLISMLGTEHFSAMRCSWTAGG